MSFAVSCWQSDTDMDRQILGTLVESALKRPCLRLRVACPKEA